MTPSVLSRAERWGIFRFSVIGHLLTSPPADQSCQDMLMLLAQKSWLHPITGKPFQIGFSTLERWYYAARREQDPVRILRNRGRGDRGRSRALDPVCTQTLQALYAAHSDWSIQLLYDNLKAQCAATTPSYATVRRYMEQQGMVRKPRANTLSAGALLARTHRDQFEVRSFEVEQAMALWHLDFHQGSLRILNTRGEWQKPQLLGILDDHSRLACHFQWYWSESAENLVHGLSQALQKRGMPRALMTDNGAAMLAEEVTQGLARLGILHQTTLPYSPYQNGKQESIWGQIEGRLLPMLRDEPQMNLATLNHYTHIWLEQAYQRQSHSALGMTPQERFMLAPSVGRPRPNTQTLLHAFRIEATRKQRRSDGTIALEGTRFEVPSHYRHMPTNTVRYPRWDLGNVSLVDPHTGETLCPMYPLDQSLNAQTPRRRYPVEPRTPVQTAPQRAPLLQKLLDDHARTGMPTPYITQEDR